MSLGDLTKEVDIVDLEDGVRTVPMRDDSVPDKLARCCKNTFSVQCCSAISSTCTSAGTHYKYFWWLLVVTVVWFIASIIIVSDEKSNHWNELEEIMKENGGGELNNQTKALLRTSVAITMKYTESISIFMIFYNLISSLLCGTLFAMLIYRYSDLYTTGAGYNFNSDPQ